MVQKSNKITIILLSICLVVTMLFVGCQTNGPESPSATPVFSPSQSIAGNTSTPEQSTPSADVQTTVSETLVATEPPTETPAPTETPTATPTPTKTPTKAPTPTKTPTKAPTPTPVKTPSPYELEKADKKDIKTPDLSGENANILILGNSFINSSNVPQIIADIAELNGENLQVYYSSEGYATISSLAHHISDDSKIKAGFYDAILVCGIFSPDTAALQSFLNAVKGTKTKILLFPASNESPSDITNARIKYPGSGYIGWLDIISEMYRYEGFAKLDFCINDYHYHLNELGGYAGALMIYNYLYQEAPNADFTEPYMLQNYGDLIPGNTEDKKLERLRTIATIAEELVHGERSYRGLFT